jgi:hypothetical protein
MPSSRMTCYDSPFAIEAHVARSFELTNGMHPKALRMSSGPDVDGLSAIAMYVVRRSPSFHGAPSGGGIVEGLGLDDDW